MQDKNTIQCALDHLVDLIILTRCPKHHIEEVAGVGQVVLWVHKGLPDTVFVSHRSEERRVGKECRTPRTRTPLKNRSEHDMKKIKEITTQICITRQREYSVVE